MQKPAQFIKGFGACFILVATIAVAAACGAVSSQSKSQETYLDSGHTANADMTNAQIIAMPDGFSNIATKCVGGDRYTVVFHSDSSYGSVAVTAADPSCK